MKEFDFLKNSKTPVSDYIKNLTPEHKKILQDFLSTAQKTLKKDFSEGISYAMPAVFYRGKAIASCIVTKTHYGYYPFGSAQIDELRDELKNDSTSSGTIRFPLNKKLPISLITKLLKLRAKLVDEKLKDPNGAIPRIAEPAKRALFSIKVKNLKGLTKYTKKEISDLHGMGPKALNLIINAMKAEGYEFKPSRK